MYLNQKDLAAAWKNGQHMEFLLFWHGAPRMGLIGPSCLTPTWPSTFIVDQYTYSSLEHWIAAEKARVFGDGDTLEKIMEVRGSARVQELSKTIRNFSEKSWTKYRLQVAILGNYHKFSQNPPLKIYLLDTKEKVLVHATPMDTIWGIGLGPESPVAGNPSRWRGENLMGFALMGVRNRLMDTP